MRRSCVLVALVAAGCNAMPGDGGDPGSGDGDVTHGDSATGGSDTGEGDTGVARCPIAIADIKTGVVAAGTKVCLHDVVVTAIGPAGVFVATAGTTANGGIYLAGASGSVSIADVVDTNAAFVGMVAGEIQLTSPAITITGTADAPSPVVTSVTELGDDAGESAALEAMLVFIPTVTVTARTHDSFTVTDDDGTHTLSVGGFLSETVLDVNVGDLFDSITGIWRATATGYELEPRGAFDLEVAF